VAALTILLTAGRAWKTTVQSNPRRRRQCPAAQQPRRSAPRRPLNGNGARMTELSPGSLLHTSKLEGPASAHQSPPPARRAATAGVASRASPNACVLTTRPEPLKAPPQPRP